MLAVAFISEWRPVDTLIKGGDGRVGREREDNERKGEEREGNRENDAP